MNKKFQKTLSVALPMFFSTNNLSFAMDFNWPKFGNFAHLNKEANNKNNITLDSYINENLVYSPFSLRAALITAANGTSDSNVRYDVAQYMGFKSLENANSWLEKITNKKIDGVNIANSMWLSEKLLNNNYLDNMLNFTGFIVDKLKAHCDFISTNDGHDVINNWVKDKTKGKIPSIFDKLDPETLLVLVNTVYFNSKFVKEFEDTGSIEFKGIDKTTKNVPTIKDAYESARSCDYCATNDYQAVRIPFEENGCYLYMVLPKTNSEFDKVKNVDTKELAKNMKSRNVHLEIPRFRIESSLTLNNYCNSNNLLQTLMDAKLDNIHPNAKISKIVQKVVFEITPEGVEAAAASGDMFVQECCQAQPEVKMVFDHAFIGFIADKDNNVLFKVNMKNYEQDNYYESYHDKNGKNYEQDNYYDKNDASSEFNVCQEDEDNYCEDE